MLCVNVGLYNCIFGVCVLRFLMDVCVAHARVSVRLGSTSDNPASFHSSPSHLNDNGRSASITAPSLHPDPEADNKAGS